MDSILKSKVEDTIRLNFGSARVDSVHIQSDLDCDGEDIFSVVVVVNAAISELNSAELVGLTRHVRSTLTAHDEKTFPIVTVMTSKDWKKQVNEAA